MVLGLGAKKRDAIGVVEVPAVHVRRVLGDLQDARRVRSEVAVARLRLSFRHERVWLRMASWPVVRAFSALHRPSRSMPKTIFRSARYSMMRPSSHFTERFTTSAPL